MLFTYKRISSLGPSHDPSSFMAEIGSRSSTQTRNIIVCTNTGSENKKQMPERRESGPLCKIAGQPSGKKFHLSPVWSLAVLHMWRRLVRKVGTTKNLPRLQWIISITFPVGLFFISNWANECTQTLKHYACISSLSVSHVLSRESVQIGCRSSANSQNAEYCAS